jgi:hypothetical protein
MFVGKAQAGGGVLAGKSKGSGPLAAPVSAYATEALFFFDRDGVLLADFHAGLATQAFLFVDRDGFTVLEFVNLHRADVDAFAVANALVQIHSNFVAHCSLQKVDSFALAANDLPSPEQGWAAADPSLSHVA